VEHSRPWFIWGSVTCTQPELSAVVQCAHIKECVKARQATSKTRERCTRTPLTSRPESRWTPFKFEHQYGTPRDVPHSGRRSRHSWQSEECGCVPVDLFQDDAAKARLPCPSHASGTINWVYSPAHLCDTGDSQRISGDHKYVSVIARGHPKRTIYGEYWDRIPITGKKNTSYKVGLSVIKGLQRESTEARYVYTAAM
jgi:hypothetical protein